MQTPGRVAGRERVRPGAGPKRRARLLRARGAPTARWTDPGRQVDAVRVSLYLPTRSPLWASSAGFKLRLLGLSRSNEARGWVFFFSSFPFCACMYVCVRKISLWRKMGAGGRREALREAAETDSYH